MVQNLPTDLQRFVEDQVTLGRYSSQEEVLASAVRLLKDRDENYQRFKAEVQRRIASAKAGNYVELVGEEALRAHVDNLITKTW